MHSADSLGKWHRLEMAHMTTDFDKYGQIYVDDGSGPAQIDDNMFSLSEVAGLKKGAAVLNLAY